MATHRILSKCKLHPRSFFRYSSPRAVAGLYQVIRNPANNVRIYDNQPQPVDVVRDIIEERKHEENNDDAFYAMDLGYCVEMIKKWKRLLPRVEPFYAIKANPDTVLLEMMTQLELGYDCASMNEIKIILDMGNPPSKIVYANTNKQLSHLQFASVAGITLTTFGDKDELFKIKRYAPDMGPLLRISTFSFTSTLYQGMTEKFGCSLSETKTLLETAKELNLCVKGVSFHVGSRCTDPNAFAIAMRESKRVFEEAVYLGFQMTVLDIGGGFPSKTANTYSLPDPELTFEKFASIIRDSLEDLFPVSRGVRVIAEPGACLAMPSTILATNIIGTRDNRHKTELPDNTASLEYFINDGIFTSMNTYISCSDLQPVVAPVSNEYDDVAQFRCALWGQTCDVDLITKDCQLPEMRTGDWLYFTGAGFEVMVGSRRLCGDDMQEYIANTGQHN